MCASSEVNKAVLQSLDKLAGEASLTSLEKPKKIFLCAKEFAKENPEMVTTTFKMKRNVGAKHFRPQIDMMYGNQSQTQLII